MDNLIQRVVVVEAYINHCTGTQITINTQQFVDDPSNIVKLNIAYNFAVEFMARNNGEYMLYPYPPTE